eukprot:762836-Hanusia_phi.AAC.11
MHIGLSAQEVEKEFPEVVALAPFDATSDENNKTVSKSGEYYKTLKYERLVPVLIQAINELNKEIQELKEWKENKNRT